ncbi:MAG: class II aldolase/adducin family protein [Lachnospiraceae bacterium]|nr:class II aldolase/adducin family protein [Lachnospiraceae bacterium]
MQGFIKISKYAGMRNDLAQAGGGNTSVKLDDKVMLVKSSGYQLADVSEDAGYSRVDYHRIVSYFEENMTETTADVLTEEKGKELLAEAQLEGGRASIETFLHSITGKYTLHSHPMLVNILTARQGGMEALRELFPEAIYVPYRKPGAALAETYYRIYRKHVETGKSSEIIFLENHGLVVSGNHADQVIAKTEEVLHSIAKYLNMNNKAYEGATRIWDMLTRIPELKDKIVYTSENKYLAWEYIGETLFKNGAWEHAFCPDCVVYAGKKILRLADDFSRGDITAFMEKYGLPTLICYHRNVYIVAESVKKAQEIENVMSFSAQVQMANKGYGMNYLDDTQMEELLNWDSEKYRRMMKA